MTEFKKDIIYKGEEYKVENVYCDLLVTQLIATY